MCEYLSLKLGEFVKSVRSWSMERLEHVLEPLNPGIWMLFMSVAANDRCPAGKCVNGEASNRATARLTLCRRRIGSKENGFMWEEVVWKEPSARPTCRLGRHASP